MTKQKSHPIDLSDPAVIRILRSLLVEFKERGMGLRELEDTYEGLPPSTLKQMCCDDGKISEVDFDIAFKELVASKHVLTGPMKMFDNPPGSTVLMLVVISENKYSYLTVAGYKLASKLAVQGS